VTLSTGVSVSYDACGTFAGWLPSAIPAEFVEAVEKPHYCNEPRVDCSNYAFQVQRPQFSDVVARRDGTIAFSVASRWFLERRTFRVTSTDCGKSWTPRAID
jgi:hypothetical protein